MSAPLDTVAVPADAYLDVPLHGVRLIEASAGTGKTFTLATLVTRLLIERGLRLEQVLAVTFTEAATQELRARLRKRLALAADIARELSGGIDSAHPDTPEVALTRQIIGRQLAFEDAATLYARLRRAEHEIDLASVFTIHGFCARLLAEHALQTGQAFDPPEMIGSERELRDELAADLWRAYGADPSDAELLQTLWSSPDQLAADLSVLLRIPVMLPHRPDDSPDPVPALQAAFDGLGAALASHGADARAKIGTAFAAKHFDGRKARAASFEQAWDSLERGVGGICLTCDDPHLDKLTPERLRSFAKAGSEDRVPTSPLFEALGEWFAADRLRTQWLAEQALILLYRLRDDARQRLELLKRTRRLQTYDDLIDDVAEALDGPYGEMLARNLRSQYAIALVDEFQDTDARQWSIFRRVFGRADDQAAEPAVPALFLIGDPKQAIYGFRGGDVHTYLAAKQQAIAAPPLTHNFRSRPGVLRAMEALYAQAGEHAFVDEGIRFHSVSPGAGTADADYQRKGSAAPALTLRVLEATAPDAESKPAPLSAPESRRIASEACVEAIHSVLSDARAGLASIDGKRVQAGDIAVLVRSHAEATRMQMALSAAGIPAVAAGKQSLFETEQADELLAVFEALLQPADEGRLRAALSTVLLGTDAAAIDRLDHDDDWRSGKQLQALAWRERWQRHGPLALVSDLCAANAERLLRLGDGERRLTNSMQLGELLQEADARSLGMHGLVDWLRAHIADADANDEQQLLRLESDARRVQILTLHKAKGLEFPLVFLPFVGVGKKEDKPSRHCQVPTASGRVLHWKLGKSDDSQRWLEAVAAWEHEQRAEDARLLYVGLTRAEHALWLAAGDFYKSDATALAPMLARWDELRGHADILIDARTPQGLPPPLPPESMSEVPPARQSHRIVPRDWWVYSFTQLSKADAGEYGVAAIAGERGAEDEPEPAAEEEFDAPVAIDYRFSGSRFGNVLHAALEHVDFAAWYDWREEAAPTGQDEPLRNALRGGGYTETELEDGLAELTRLVGRTLTAPLPEGGRLCQLPVDARRAELEFHFALKPTSVEALLATLHAHGVLPGRRAFGLRRQLEGLMTGKIDLTYHRDGRWYLLDYKSNRLPAYDAASLDLAMAHSEYDLQALIYTLALHRWLRFRLGDAYDYARDFGGARYLFCRGLDMQGDTVDGIHAWKPPLELISALDALFAGGGA